MKDRCYIGWDLFPVPFPEGWLTREAMTGEQSPCNITDHNCTLCNRCNRKQTVITAHHLTPARPNNVQADVHVSWKVHISGYCCTAKTFPKVRFKKWLWFRHLFQKEDKLLFKFCERTIETLNVEGVSDPLHGRQIKMDCPLIPALNSGVAGVGRAGGSYFL